MDEYISKEQLKLHLIKQIDTIEERALSKIKKYFKNIKYTPYSPSRKQKSVTYTYLTADKKNKITTTFPIIKKSGIIEYEGSRKVGADIIEKTLNDVDSWRIRLTEVYTCDQLLYGIQQMAINLIRLKDIEIHLKAFKNCKQVGETNRKNAKLTEELKQRVIIYYHNNKYSKLQCAKKFHSILIKEEHLPKNKLPSPSTIKDFLSQVKRK